MINNKQNKPASDLSAVAGSMILKMTPRFLKCEACETIKIRREVYVEKADGMHDRAKICDKCRNLPLAQLRDKLFK